MLIEPHQLASDHARLESIEKASIRLVTQGILDFRETAAEIFRAEHDLVQDFGEDITREALDRMGVSKIDQRLFGKIDYKRARYVFHPDYTLRQALFVDSKAEKGDEGTATLQTAQTSLRMRHIRAGHPVDEEGKLPAIIDAPSGSYLTTTIFVKYLYSEVHGSNSLKSITIAGVPSGLLQDLYNPTPEDTIWRTGRNAPSRGEPFRVRLVFARLKAKCPWRIQHIPMGPEEFQWSE